MPFKISFLSQVKEEKLGQNGGRAFADFAHLANPSAPASQIWDNDVFEDRLLGLGLT